MSKRLLLNRIYRQCRTFLYVLLQPADAVFRRMNRLEHYPPIALRRHAGCLGTMDGVGAEFVAYLKLLLGLDPSHRLLDLGCGCGLLELALETAGWYGRLVGMDIHKPSIEWARRMISRRIPSFTFIHADIHNDAYWPRGRSSAKQWFEQFNETGFDIILAKSLFTHMLPDELDVYLEAVSHRLAPSGKGLLTFFLLNETQRRSADSNAIRFVTVEGVSHYAVRRHHAPTAAVAYEESYVLDRIQRHGLRLVHPIYFGSWSGTTQSLSFQDLVTVVRQD